MKTKTITFSLFGLLTAILAGVSIALYVIDWNQYRDTLADLASDRLGVQVELAGDLSLTFLPRPAVAARLVRISPGQAGFNDAIATADKLDMSLGLGALLTGSLELQSLALEGLSASVVETNTGWTLQGWPAAEGDEEGGTTLLSLDRFRINSGSISIIPMGADPIAVEGLDLTLAGQLPRGPLDWQGSAIVAGESMTVEGRIAPTRTVDATSIKSTLTFDAGLIDFSGRFMPDGSVQGRLQSEGNDLKSFASSLSTITSYAGTIATPALPYGFDLQVERDSRGVSRLISRRAFLGATRGVLDLTVAESDDAVHLAGTMSIGVVPLDLWLETIAFPTAEEPQTTELAAVGFTGGLDLNIETIEFRGDQAQQVGASIGFGEDGFVLTHATALLPGASRLSYQSSSARNGTFQFQSGGLQEMLSWIGFELPDAVPDGRLRTADLTGGIGLNGNAWVVTGLTGAIDTSGIEADISGVRSPFAVNAIRFDADRLNLDAYWPVAALPDMVQSEQMVVDRAPIDFAVSVRSLYWLGQSFSSLSATGSVGSDEISVASATVNNLDGSATGSFEARSLAEEIAEISASITFDAWRFPVVTELAPDAGQFINLFTGNSPASGVLELNGPTGDIQARAELRAAKSSLVLAGTLAQGEEWQGRLQGTVSHQQVGRLLARARLWEAGSEYRLPLTSNISVDGSMTQFSGTATGELDGAQFNLSVTKSANGHTGEVSIAVGPNQQTDLDRIVSNAGYALDFAAPRRARFAGTVEEGGWRLSAIDVRNGQAKATGTLASENGILGGALTVAGADLGRLNLVGNNDDASLMQVSSISVDIEGLEWLGQALVAPQALISGDGSSVNFSLGESAQLNTGPVNASLTYTQGTGAFSASVDVGSFDIGRFSRAIDAADGFSGVVTASLNIAGNNASPNGILGTLSGQGRFEGGAGSLYFLAVPELINAIQSENTAGSFLQSIGQLLRSGQTDFATIRGSFQLDSGVALVDELLAAGEWGQLELDGQLNIPSDYINVSGALALSQPIDAPAIPVTYEGALSQPNVRWTSRAIEQFAIAGIERRLRTRLFGELEAAQANSGGEAAPNPGAFVSRLAAGLLGSLKARQEARRQAQEAAETNGQTSPTSEEQRP